MADVAIFSFGRTGSQRCPNKMLRPFAGTTLTDITLSKLKALTRPAFFAGYEPEFRDRCELHGVPFVQRDVRSVTIDEPISDILSFLRPLDYSHFLCVSAAMPFLTPATIERFLDECLGEGAQSSFGVHRRANHLMTLDRRPLNFDIGNGTINTKTVQPVLEFAHALYFFDKDYLFAHQTLWDWSSVRLVEMGSKLELVDVDTEEDFAFAEDLWKGRHGVR